MQRKLLISTLICLLLSLSTLLYAESPAVFSEPAMVKIPAGDFMMGCIETKICRPDELPRHKVTIAQPFWLGKYEITWDEYQPCIDDGVCRVIRRSVGQGNKPVVHVSWDEITTDYIPWLNEKTGKNYRLPTESEWEYAARAGGHMQYPFGNDKSQLCTYANGAALEIVTYGGKDKPLSFVNRNKSCRDGYTKKSPVGSLMPNKFGIYDMQGNVWEWTADCWNNNYENTPTDGSAWLTEACKSRVIRGGAWHSSPYYLRPALRNRGSASGGGISFGFRLARDDENDGQ